jgi:cellulose synthase/poly-beta-1,6-N-acetylglucosamine synthase-like glycosyltransferase
MTSNPMELAFWICLAGVLYAYVGYAALLAVAAKLFKRAPRRQAGFAPTVSLVVAAHNEEARVGTRVAELAGLLAASGVQGEVIVVSDGSTDATVNEARRQRGPVIVLDLPDRVGKAAALNAGCAAASREILVFADSRQRWDKTALGLLLENFADPHVGAVSGDLVLETKPGVMAGVGLYWHYEKWLRKKESQIHSTVGVTGAICAVRRELFPGVPDGTILDDVYWPLRVAMRGYRVIHDQRALAYDCLPGRARDEFRRKVRTLAGNFQLVARLPGVLLPWRNPLWLQFLSHKLLRLAVPWALLAMLVLSGLLGGPLYMRLFWWQAGFYATALLGNLRAVNSRLRPAGTAASLLVLNAAAWMAFWVWISGRAGRSWNKVAYHPAGVGTPTPT